jgi:hypothetical protein
LKIGNVMETKYYKEQLNDGLEFQDFCSIKFAERGIPITNFSSKKYQQTKGENLQGYEFKYDKQFRKTGNFWIELAEKSNSENSNYVNSGILRNDNTMFYIIGDYDGVYLMQKKILIVISARYSVKENNMKTSKGFLFPVEKAREYFDYIKF